MKLYITLKDPDGVYDSLFEAADDSVRDVEGLSDVERADLRDERRAEFEQMIGKWFEYSEYLRVEVDTDAGTIRVLENNDEGF